MNRIITDKIKAADRDVEKSKRALQLHMIISVSEDRRNTRLVVEDKFAVVVEPVDVSVGEEVPPREQTGAHHVARDIPVSADADLQHAFHTRPTRAKMLLVDRRISPPPRATLVRAIFDKEVVDLNGFHNSLQIISHCPQADRIVFRVSNGPVTGAAKHAAHNLVHVTVVRSPLAVFVSWVRSAAGCTDITLRSKARCRLFERFSVALLMGRRFTRLVPRVGNTAACVVPLSVVAAIY